MDNFAYSSHTAVHDTPPVIDIIHRLATDPLQAEMEIALAARWQQLHDTDARDRMIRANARFVVTVAKDFQGRGLDLAELISAGNIGLVEAVDRFDGTRGLKFITYAVWWIRQAILKALAEETRVVTMPMSHMSSLTKIHRTDNELSHRMRRAATPDEIREAVGFTPQRYEDAVALEPGELSLSGTPHDDSDTTYGDLLTDPEAVSVADTTIQDESRAALMAAMDTLTPRERSIMVMRYGLDGSEPRTLQEIGRKFKLHRERIRQIQEIVLDKLRAVMGVEVVEV